MNAMAHFSLSATPLFAHGLRGLLIAALESLLIAEPSAAKTKVVQDSWIRTVSMIGDFQNIEATPDGGYIALSHYPGATLLKFNADGRITWAKSNSMGPSYGVSVLPSPLGGYVGLLLAMGEGFVEQPYVIRFSAQGNVLWQRGIDIPQSDSGYQRLAVAADGSIYAICIADDPIVMKLDDAGHVIWQQTIATTSPIYSGNILALANNDLLIALSPSLGSSDSGIRFMRLNAAGQILWQKRLDIAIAYSVAELGNHEIVMLAARGSIFKFDGSGNLVWQKTYQDAGTFSSIHLQVKPAPANSFVVIGYTNITSPTNSNTYYNSDLRLFKADNNGGILWSKRFGLTGLANDQRGSAIAQGLDGHYLAVGHTSLSGSIGLVLRLDSAGNMATNCSWNIPSTTQIGTTTSVIASTSFIPTPAALRLLTSTVTMTNKPITTEPICGQPDDNAAPVANAGTNNLVFFGNTLQLDGSASSDPDGDGLSYGWQQTGGEDAALMASDSPIATFTAPTRTQTLTFTLVVTDYLGLVSAPANITVQVRAPFPNQFYLPLSLR